MDTNEDCEMCWICLEGMEGTDISLGPLHGNRLIKPCRCPRVVHSVCLAKWQLSQSGKSEEKFCRFCKERLPEWQANLALPGMGAVEPVMSVHFNGQTHMVKVKPGEEGRVVFIQDVRRLLRLRENQEFSITFECKVPGHGMFLDLKGLSSYDAAVFCAAMTAVERQRLAAQKANKAGAAHSSRVGGGAGNLLPTSVPVASSPLSGEAASTASSSASGNSSRSSDGSGSGGTGGSDSAGSSSAVNSTTSTVSTSSPSPTFYATSRAITPAMSQSVRRPRTTPGSRGDGLEPGFNEASDGQMGLGSVTSIGIQPSRLPNANGDAIVGEAATVPSVSSALSRAAQPGCVTHGPIFAAPREPVLQSALAASSGGHEAAHAGISAPPSVPYQHPVERNLRPPNTPWVCGGNAAYDSACEVEPGIAGSEGGAANATEMDVSSPAATSQDTYARHKFLLWHGFRGRPVLGGSSSSSSSSSIQPPVRRPLPARRTSERSSAGTWLTRLLLCASFGGRSQESGR
ncbi:hypothetical protein VaNZ11_001101 [Volvox africanus]|uniref:RING-CH-type domain-containing protein n=1 Tax=Volvox africanus TaxID=51714 RepID=A0ABQ5RNZ4_9CHLO|nr:hypothetical protein VaNZ11_001101 [Volvox africanus]